MCLPLPLGPSHGIYRFVGFEGRGAHSFRCSQHPQLLQHRDCAPKPAVPQGTAQRGLGTPKWNQGITGALRCWLSPPLHHSCIPRMPAALCRLQGCLAQAHHSPSTGTFSRVCSHATSASHSRLKNVRVVGEGRKLKGSERT